MSTTASRSAAPVASSTNSSLHIPQLDATSLKKLSSEPNSSKYAIDAHNRGVHEIRDLSELPKLCSLDVSFNHLKSLANLHTAKELRELKCYNNKLSTLRGLRANGMLEGLLAHENQLDEISDDLMALVKLKALWLNGNHISTVQHLGACRLLVHLDLSRNRLTGSVAEGLESLSSLEFLNVSSNQLSSIGNLTHLTKLEELNLSSNSLTTLQGGLLPANLTVLRLNDNRLKSLDSFPTHLAQLNELYLQQNTITDMGSSLAVKCPKLESLDVRDNGIRSINVLQTAGLTGLMDLWIRGNPCCLSSTYLLDTLAMLPELKTLDNLTDTQLKSHLDALKDGSITQGELLASLARPMTGGSGGRPGTASSRPGSSSSLHRPITPSTSSSRPGTPGGEKGTGAPIFHHQSSRAGTLLKVAPASELEKAHADVADRLEKIKAMIGRIGKKDTLASKPNERPPPPQQHQQRRRSQGGAPSRGPDENQDHVNAQSEGVVAALPTKPKRGGVDAGTDPLDSLMRSYTKGEQSRAVPPETLAPRRGMETQTQTATTLLPPAPLVNALAATAKKVKISMGSQAAGGDNNQMSAAPHEEESSTHTDGDLIEQEMMQLLLQYATPSHDDQMKDMPEEQGVLGDHRDDDDEGNQQRMATESPRIATNKLAEQRLPPKPSSRQGYRSFRMPPRTSRDSENSTIA